MNDPATRKGVTALAFSADGSLLAAGWSDGWLVVFSMDSLQVLYRAHCTHVPIVTLAWDSSGRVLLVDEQAVLYVWDRSQGVLERREHKEHAARVLCASFSADTERYCLVSASPFQSSGFFGVPSRKHDVGVYAFEKAEPCMVGTLHSAVVRDCFEVGTVLLSPDGCSLYGTSMDRVYGYDGDWLGDKYWLHRWDALSFEESSFVELPEDHPASAGVDRFVAIAPDESFVAAQAELGSCVFVPQARLYQDPKAEPEPEWTCWNYFYDADSTVVIRDEIFAFTTDSTRLALCTPDANVWVGPVGENYWSPTSVTEQFSQKEFSSSIACSSQEILAVGTCEGAIALYALACLPTPRWLTREGLLQR